MGAFYPGNITVTSRASNQMLRRLATCDVACLVSQSMTNGVGLSRAQLLNLRYAAMSYRRGSYTPKYLVQGMVEYGINFATFEALSSNTLDALHASLRQGWRQGGEDQESDESDVSVEPLISYSFPQNRYARNRQSSEPVNGGSTLRT